MLRSAVPPNLPPDGGPFSALTSCPHVTVGPGPPTGPPAFRFPLRSVLPADSLARGFHSPPLTGPELPRYFSPSSRRIFTCDGLGTSGPGKTEKGAVGLPTAPLLSWCIIAACQRAVKEKFCPPSGPDFRAERTEGRRRRAAWRERKRPLRLFQAARTQVLSARFPGKRFLQKILKKGIDKRSKTGYNSHCSVRRVFCFQRTPAPVRNGAVVQLVRTPACHAGGRGFKSLPRRHLKLQPLGCVNALRGEDAAIAQSVERILGKDEVPSSNLGSSSTETLEILGFQAFFVLKS